MAFNSELSVHQATLDYANNFNKRTNKNKDEHKKCTVTRTNLYLGHMSDARFFLVVGLPTVLHCFNHVVLVLHTPDPKGVNEINNVFYVVVYVALCISKNN